MNKTFDELWMHPVSAGLGVRCPLDAATLETMIAKAVARPPARRHAAPIAAAVAVAAGAALVLVPVTGKSHAATISTVDYNGQSVRFLCNHHCSPDDVIPLLDNYTESL